MTLNVLGDDGEGDKPLDDEHSREASFDDDDEEHGNIVNFDADGDAAANGMVDDDDGDADNVALDDEANKVDDDGLAVDDDDNDFMIDGSEVDNDEATKVDDDGLVMDDDDVKIMDDDDGFVSDGINAVDDGIIDDVALMKDDSAASDMKEDVLTKGGSGGNTKDDDVHDVAMEGGSFDNDIEATEDDVEVEFMQGDNGDDGISIAFTDGGETKDVLMAVGDGFSRDGDNADEGEALNDDVYGVFMYGNDDDKDDVP